MKQFALPNRNQAAIVSNALPAPGVCWGWRHRARQALWPIGIDGRDCVNFADSSKGVIIK